MLTCIFESIHSSFSQVPQIMAGLLKQNGKGVFNVLLDRVYIQSDGLLFMPLPHNLFRRNLITNSPRPKWDIIHKAYKQSRFSQLRIQGGAKGAMPPPVPVKTSHKKDGRHRRLLISHVSCPPMTMLDPMLFQLFYLSSFPKTLLRKIRIIWKVSKVLQN